MKPNDIKSSTYIYFDVKSYDKNPKFKIRNHVRRPKYMKFFQKRYTQNLSKDQFS